MPYPVPPPEPPAIIETVVNSSLNQPPSYQSWNQSESAANGYIQHNQTISYVLPSSRSSEIHQESSAALLGEPVTLNWSDVYGKTQLYLIPRNEVSWGIFEYSPTTPIERGFLGEEFCQNAIASSSQVSYGINSSEQFTLFDRHRPLYLAQTEPSGSDNIPIPVIPPTDLVEVTAAEQEFDQQRQIITARGNVRIRFRETLIEADQAQVNLNTRQTAARGNVALQRGEQLVQGSQMEYNFVRSTGVIYQARGVVVTQSTASDFDIEQPTNLTPTPIFSGSLSDTLTEAQPVTEVTTTGETQIQVTGAGFPQVGGTVNRLRFEAERIDIQPNGEWKATNIRITNDPFSPPELELRADNAQLRRISPLQDELLTSRSRLVFDQRFSIPLFRDRTIIDRRQREPSPLEFGYDLRDLDGYFVQWNLTPIELGPLELKVAPQVLVQRAISEGLSPLDPRFYGLNTRLSGRITPTTSVEGQLKISNFEDFPDLEENAYRGRLRVRQSLEDYTLTGEYSYRERIFNGTLGSQTVHRSFGVVLTVPNILIGPSGGYVNFQTGYQAIEANTDRFDLLEEERQNDRINRQRFQTVGTLIYPIPLWSGSALPATASEGLRYTPRPVIPFVRLVGIARGSASLYSEDESQFYLSSSVGIQGQLGHFSRSYLDYTGFSIFYTQVAIDGASPFLFDRMVDQRILTLALVQQIYGGLRGGVESAINLDSGLALNNEFTLEYSRRTYGVVLRINPVQRLGSFSLRISDFNWTGDSPPFDD